MLLIESFESELSTFFSYVELLNQNRVIRHFFLKISEQKVERLYMSNDSVK